MDVERNRPQVSRPLIYLGILVLVFLIGLGCGLGVLGRWVWSPGPSPATSLAAAATPSPGATATAREAPGRAAPTLTPTPCGPPPAAWVPYIVQPGDTLSALAAQAGVSQESLLRANCLTSAELLAGQVLRIPALPTPTPCRPAPAGWAPYTVQSGDTLFGLATQAGVSQESVLEANCLTSTDLMAGQVLYLPSPPTPSPTPCEPSPPAGWTSYTVRAGDTLFSLAATRGTTTDEVMQANCLSSPQIVVGQVLYLPPLSLPTPPAEALPQLALATQPAPALPGGPAPSLPLAPVPQPAPVALADPFKPSAKALPSYPLEIGRPSVITACASGDKITRIDPLDKEEAPRFGTRAYYYACDFPDPATLTATLVGADGQQYADLLLLLTYPLSRDLKDVEPDLQKLYPELTRGEGSAQAVVVWSVVCDLPPISYTLVLEDSQGGHAERIVQPTEDERKKPQILAVPQIAPVGTGFQVHYCNYPPNSAVSIGLYYDEKRKYEGGVLKTVSMRRNAVLPVSTDGLGRAKKELPTLPDSLPGFYNLRGEEKSGGLDKIWLHSR